MNIRALSILASILSFRMLGLFMILPVFSAAAQHYHGATPALIGLTLGIYGFTQAVLQIPFGALSDRIGRKAVIIMGLSLFLLGSLVCALSHDIHYLILGRALQGAGAIGSTVLAFVADITPDNQRGKAMAMMGLFIGLSFMLAMMLGPSIRHFFNLSAIFWFSAMLSVLGILLSKYLPSHARITLHYFEEKNCLKKLLSRQLLCLDAGIFLLHAILTALFIVIPLILTQQLHADTTTQALIYCAVLFLAFLFALPCIALAEAKNKMHFIYSAAIACLVLVTGLACISNARLSLSGLITLLLLFFTAFTTLEALLPALLAKRVSANRKGAAMGIYSSSQFLGIFVGGSLGGLIFSHWGSSAVFTFCLVMSLVWFWLTLLRDCTVKQERVS